MNNKAFVIGHPISHSRSPLIHNHWLEQNHISASYQAIDVSIDKLDGFFEELRLGKYVGGNVTIPHKQMASQLCDRLTSTALTLGAINTIYREKDLILGDNTDGYGFLANLDQQAPGWDDQLDQVVILGAGGAARAIILALMERRAQKIIILNRTPGKAGQLAERFSALNNSSAIFRSSLSAGSLFDFAAHAPATTLLVNTSSVGLDNTAFREIDPALLPGHALVHDIVYNPLQTPLLHSASKNGLKTIDGLGMLLHQAAPGFQRWFGMKPVIDAGLRQLVIDQMQ